MVWRVFKTVLTQVKLFWNIFYLFVCLLQEINENLDLLFVPLFNMLNNGMKYYKH